MAGQSAVQEGEQTGSSRQFLLSCLFSRLSIQSWCPERGVQAGPLPAWWPPWRVTCSLAAHDGVCVCSRSTLHDDLHDTTDLQPMMVCACCCPPQRTLVHGHRGAADHHHALQERREVDGEVPGDQRAPVVRHKDALGVTCGQCRGASVGEGGGIPWEPEPPGLQGLCAPRPRMMSRTSAVRMSMV